MNWDIWPWPATSDVWSPFYVLGRNGNAVLLLVMIAVHYLLGRLLGHAVRLPPWPVALLVCVCELVFNGALGTVKAIQVNRTGYLLYHLDYALLAMLCTVVLAVALSQEWARPAAKGVGRGD